MKEFNKNTFQRNQNRLATIAFLIGVLAVASLVCGFLIGDGFAATDDGSSGAVYNEADAVDIIDCVGTFYAASDDLTIWKLDVSPNGAVISLGNPLHTETLNFKCSYASAEYVSKGYGHSYNDCPAILLYENDLKQINMILWVQKSASGEYSLYLQNKNMTYTRQEITWSDLMGDPKNYYGEYAYGENNQLVLRTDGTATFTLNGNTEEYTYFYANGAWLYNNTKYSAAHGIIVWQKETEALYFFALMESGNLYLNDTYEFVAQ